MAGALKKKGVVAGGGGSGEEEEGDDGGVKGAKGCLVLVYLFPFSAYRSSFPFPPCA